MELQITATDQLTIAVAKDQDASEFDRELTEQLPPGREISIRDIL